MAGTRNKAKLDEVRDEEGRRRFHGAFTGGFSAGFYNSVGSKEGWQPKTWQSSRGSRAAQQAQRPEDFMDDEDGLLGRELEAQLPYDTLGEQARRLVRDQAGRQAQGAAIPGLEAVDELLAPTGVAIGKKLLQLMGWKEGVGVGSRQMRKRQRRASPEEEGEGAEEEEQMDDAAFLPEHLRAQAAERGMVQQGRIAFARRDVESFALPTAKDDLYGLGFDPDKHAPEFAALREAARARDDRGVYRMGDVKGQASSSRAGPRDATGFALDDSEDDVYDADAPLAMLRTEVGAGAGGKAARYDTVLRGLEEEEEEEEEAAGRRRGRDAGAAHRMALEEWIGGAGDVSSKGKGPSRCPTDSRPVPDGFVLGVQQWAFKQAFWAPPTPPRSFVPFHRFEEEEEEEEEQAKHSAAVAGQREAHRGRLVASARGTLLGESKPEPPPGGGGSVFDLMSEADRGRLLGKAQAVASSGAEGDQGGSAGVLPLAAQVAGGPVGVFQGMQGALAKRFSVVEAPKTAASLQEGLIEKSALGGIAPAVAPAPPPPKPLREPTRSQALWYPAALLCKRFGVPVPQHAKLTPVANAGAGGLLRGGMQPPPSGAAAPAPGSLLSNKFEQEMSALLPGGDLLAQAQQAEGEGLVEVEEEPVAAAAAEEAALPAFEAKPRPAKDFFKAIFEASDSEEEEDEEDEESDGGEEGDGKNKAAAGVVKPEIGEEGPAPKQAAVGGVKKAERVGNGGGGGSSSPPRDHFLQPAVAGGESIEEILAKGPVLIQRKKRLAVATAADGGGGGEEDEEEEEEEEGLVFGAAVIKKQPKKRPKPTSSSSTSSTSAAPAPTTASAGATPPTLRRGDETPPPGSTLMMARAAELPPTPPPPAARAEASAPPPVPSALVQSSIKQEEGDDSSSGGSSSDEDKGASMAKGAAAEAAPSSRDRERSSRHKKEKKRRKESSRKDSKKSSKKHRKEERKRHREGDSSEDGSSRRRHKKSKHHRR